jgi:curved DNA-binding protein CbpA
MTAQDARAPVPFKDYYAVMRLDAGATSDDVHRRYRELLREYATDGTGAAGARIDEINEAYRVLSSSAFRREYDQVWSTRVTRPSSALATFDEQEVAQESPQRPPLAVMAKQHARARAPRPKELPKRRFSIRGLLFKLGLLSAYWVIVGPTLIASVS